MSKALVLIVSIIVGFISFASVASLSGGGKFDYATADEERKQQFLDNVAKGFTHGFKMTAGKSAEITQIFTDSSLDLISISIQYNDQRVETVSATHIEKQRVFMAKQSCRMAKKQKLLEMGVTMRMRLYRPSGAKMGVVQIDSESCAHYIR